MSSDLEIAALFADLAEIKDAFVVGPDGVSPGNGEDYERRMRQFTIVYLLAPDATLSLLSAMRRQLSKSHLQLRTVRLLVVPPTQTTDSFGKLGPFNSLTVTEQDEAISKRTGSSLATVKQARTLLVAYRRRVDESVLK